jgi:GMP synthase (glutamine-hydrolysing)
MKVAIFQHVPNEPAGFFETFFLESGIPVEHVRLFETQEIPRTDATHALFLGGPMSVNDEREYPYLREEKAFIRKAVKDDRPVIGICLGAQLIASAFGAKVYPFVQETGWHELHRTPDVTGIFAAFPEQFQVFQLHGETFEIPYGGRLLCMGGQVHNQAFSYKSALGLQFHLELTDAIIRDWTRSLRHYQQEKITRETPRFISESNRLCRLIAEDFVSR